MNKLFYFLVLLLSTAIVFTSCKKDEEEDNNNNNNNNTPTTVTDGGGNVYNTVVIGSQVWMKENLKHDVTGSFCFDNSTSNCNTYGRLYTYQAASTACPTGWRLPTDNDWKTLEKTLGMSQAHADAEGWDRGTDQGTKLKVGGSSGFNAKLAGFRNPLQLFENLDAGGYFWTSTVTQNDYAFNREINLGAKVTRTFNVKTYAFSVRCIKN